MRKPPRQKQRKTSPPKDIVQLALQAQGGFSELSGHPAEIMTTKQADLCSQIRWTCENMRLTLWEQVQPLMDTMPYTEDLWRLHPGKQTHQRDSIFINARRRKKSHALGHCFQITPDRAQKHSEGPAAQSILDEIKAFNSPSVTALAQPSVCVCVLSFAYVSAKCLVRVFGVWDPVLVVWDCKTWKKERELKKKNNLCVIHSCFRGITNIWTTLKSSFCLFSYKADSLSVWEIITVIFSVFVGLNY